MQEVQAVSSAELQAAHPVKQPVHTLKEMTGLKNLKD